MTQCESRWAHRRTWNPSEVRRCRAPREWRLGAKGAPSVLPARLLPQPAASDSLERSRRIPARPRRPKPKSARLEGSGTLVTPVRENAALKVGAVEPPTMSVPIRSQWGSRDWSLKPNIRLEGARGALQHLRTGSLGAAT
jgi:hypothetical protein